MAQTPEEKKIKRLETELDKFKKWNEALKQEKERLEHQVEYERRWRMDFQKLMKAATQEDNLTEYERSYW
jgi:predicted RNase H-like nuclease (RuvC/YqgF family)